MIFKKTTKTETGSIKKFLIQGTDEATKSNFYATVGRLHEAGFSVITNTSGTMEKAFVSGKRIHMSDAMSLYNGLLCFDSISSEWKGRFKTEDAFNIAVRLVESHLGDITTKQKLKDESIDNKVTSWAHLEFHKPKILEMCENASKDREQNMIAPKAYPEHTMFDANLNTIKQGSIDEQLKYLIVHGYTGECIYNQAGINK